MRVEIPSASIALVRKEKLEKRKKIRKKVQNRIKV